MQARWVEHLIKAWDTFLEDIFSFVPEDTKKHLKNAKKEILLAFKSALEEKIKDLEDEKKEVKKIKVEKEK